MAKSFLVPINMNGLEIQNFLAHNLASAPTGVAGKIYFNTVDHKLYYHNGTEWVDLTASSNTTYTLTQSGSTITLTGSDGSTMTVSGEANQNAFSNVKVDNTTLSADSKTDTLNLVSGNNITLVPTASSDTIEIQATDTTYSDATQSASGLMSSTDKTKLDGIADGAEVNVQSDWNQTTTTADDYIKNKPTLGTAASKNSTTSITSGGAGLPTAGTVYDYVASAIGAVDAMRFKGTVNSNSDLPTSGVKVGDTYMVNTAGTYAGQTCEVGDLIIATATTPTWTVAQTNIDGAITSISGTAPISVTGSGSSRTVSISDATQSASGAMSDTDKTKLDGIEAGAEVNRTYTSFTGKPTSNQTPGFGSTFTISQISQDATGQVSGTDRTVKIPDTKASTSAFGIMKVGYGLSASSGTVNADVRKGTATMLAGTLTHSLISSSTRLCGYTAMDATTGEEVVLDCKKTSSGYEWTIASAYANDIRIDYAYYL